MRFTRRGKITVVLAALLAVGVSFWPRQPELVTEDDVGNNRILALDFLDLTELVIDFADGTSLDAIKVRHPSLKGVAWNSPNVEDEAIATAQVTLAEREAVLAELSADPEVEFAELNQIVRLSPIEAASEAQDSLPDDGEPNPTKVYPNDPLYEKQWNMRMVQGREAWRYATGEDVIVAVIDTGVAYEDDKGLWAPDLKDTLFVPGYDFVNNDAVAADDHGHGTHCAGTIAQSTNNGRGVVGLARSAKIMPLKVLSAGGWGTISDIADAIRFAADNGAQVLSLSLGGGGYSKVMASAVAHARAKGCMVVCAAGNGYGPPVGYPAAYPGATAVSSVGETKELAFYSSYGKQVFISAPGGDKRKGAEGGVLQNTIDPRSGGTVYAWYQGTSMATPHVAGASALLYSVGVTRPDAIEAILASTSTRSKGGEKGWNSRFGWGVLDAGAAVRHAVFLPGMIALGLAGVLVFFTTRRTDSKHVLRALLGTGAVMGASGLFFLRPLGLGEVPFVGELLCRSMATWDVPLFGASWHWTPIFASALIPATLGFVSVRSRLLRSLAIGLCLGWSARLATGILLPYADVRWIPGWGLLDAMWLGVNAGGLVMAAAALSRLGRGKDQADDGVRL